MPVKWTAENDHLLLLTLLETHSVRVDGEKIRAAWPSNGSEIPTARAIKERITKIRSLAGSNSNSPAKASVSHVNNGVKKESSPRKRGRPRKAAVDQGNEEMISQSFKSGSPHQSFASTVQDAADVTPSPTPRKRRAAKIKTEKTLKFDSEASDVIDLESSGDDFVPTKVGIEEDEDDEYLGD
ncbi:uncharacterized protein DFL_002640 [Arthrobotrys flagrans]|uniref:Uncharacterized protein n=1 Tax=Arthrobotrys flagrans TaxID=97331 RepID=A0A437AB25_ARTFL|nr:hypothetical protein DFL_002640 [Arthrobotrys flagrans]